MGITRGTFQRSSGGHGQVAPSGGTVRWHGQVVVAVITSSSSTTSTATVEPSPSGLPPAS